MKKSLLWTLVLLITVSMLSAFSFTACAGETAVTTAAETTAAVTTAAETTAAEVTPAEKELPVVVAYVPWVYDPSDFYGVFHAGLQDGMDENFGAGNWDMPMRIPANVDDHIGQLNIVEDMISLEVDYIVICPTSYEGQIELYRKVNESEIPLFIFNYEKPFPEEWGVWAYNYAGYSHADGGRATADYIAENYPEGTEMAIIHGTPIYTSSTFCNADIIET